MVKRLFPRFVVFFKFPISFFPSRCGRRRKSISSISVLLAGGVRSIGNPVCLSVEDRIDFTEFAFESVFPDIESFKFTCFLISYGDSRPVKIGSGSPQHLEFFVTQRSERRSFALSVDELFERGVGKEVVDFTEITLFFLGKRIPRRELDCSGNVFKLGSVVDEFRSNLREIVEFGDYRVVYVTDRLSSLGSDESVEFPLNLESGLSGTDLLHDGVVVRGSVIESGQLIHSGL